jgi:hypothetical protein
MPRGEQQEEQNGHAQYDFDPVERFDPSEFHPDAPVGGWEFVVCANETKRKATNPKEEGDKRYPMVIFVLSLKRALEEENASHEGTKIDFLITAWGPEKPKRGNQTKRNLNEFCKAIGVDMGLFPHGGALSTGSFAVFDEFIEACEGREGKLWTYHSPNGDTGEVYTNIAWKPPTKGKASTASANGAPAPKASRNGTASGKKPAARASARR